MTELLIENIRALDPGRGEIASALLIREGRIAAFDPPPPQTQHISRVDGGGRLLTPGLIDVHTHGIEQFSFEAGPDVLTKGLGRLGRYGVTSVLPTLYRVMEPKKLDELAALATALNRCHDTHVPGFHLEGPFLALPGAGAATLNGDVALLDEIIAAANGRVASMSISPDTPQIVPVIEQLAERGIVVFMTHTRATAEQTRRAIDAGACHATHFYDVFPIPKETEPGVRPVGVVETVLADPQVSVDFIADGVHVDPTAILAALAAKGYEGVILITDANIGAGMPDGLYETAWGYPVKIQAGDAARIHQPTSPNHGHLAGSCLTMDLGMSNLLNWLPGTPEQIWQLGTSNPARLMTWHDKGTLRPGADADLVLWDVDPHHDHRLLAHRTWVAGTCVFERNGVNALNRSCGDS